jgi:hypothetical protein
MDICPYLYRIIGIKKSPGTIEFNVGGLIFKIGKRGRTHPLLRVRRMMAPPKAGNSC